MKRILAYAIGLVAVGSASVFALHVLKPEGTVKNVAPAAVIGSQEVSTTERVPIVIAPPTFHYIEVIDGCGPYYNGGPCVNMRSGPGTEYPIVDRLRTGVVFKVEGTTVKDGYEWYKIILDSEIRYPERVNGDWYVAADPEAVLPFNDVGEKRIMTGKTTTTTKHIIVSRSEEMLYAYEGGTLFMKEPISTGLEFTPTPRGMFTVYYKTPSRYMQGPIPGISDQEYDLPGVPWNLYFTEDGAVIHGAYWHDHFGEPWSHGCVNLRPEKAKELYQWADLGTPVTVRD